MANVMVTTSLNVGSVPTLARPRRDSASSSREPKHLLSKISFSGYWLADRKYVLWLESMEALHGETWRKAGIYEAIKASAYNIRRNPSLVLSVAEKWCSETNTFLFPWGEATVTLEDVMVLLGFSVLGSPAFAPLESSKMRETAEKLHKVRKELNSEASGRVRWSSWSSEFFGNGNQMEHEAFLVLWLSFYAFPRQSTRAISKKVIPIAVRLARGERIALAPAVLAGIYRDLGQLHDLAKGGMSDGDKAVNLKSLLKLVQVWTWERFQSVRPIATVIPVGEPRIARWDGIQQKFENVRMSFDDFEWRPYTKPLRNWNPLQFYVEEAMLVTLDDNLDDQFKSYARCVRVSQLVADGFVEGYYPDRVGRQFGLAQYIPDSVNHRRDFTEKEAWDHYSRSLADLKVYMPSRLERGYVDPRYRDWWLKSVSAFLSSEEATKESFESSHADLDISPKVLPLSEVVQMLEGGFPAKLKRTRTCRLAKKYKERACDDESLKDEEDDNMTIAQRIRSRKKYFSDVEETGGDDCKSLGKRRRKFQVVDSDDSDQESLRNLQEMSDSIEKSIEEAKRNVALIKEQRAIRRRNLAAARWI